MYPPPAVYEPKEHKRMTTQNNFFLKRKICIEQKNYIHYIKKKCLLLNTLNVILTPQSGFNTPREKIREITEVFREFLPSRRTVETFIGFKISILDETKCLWRIRWSDGIQNTISREIAKHRVRTTRYIIILCVRRRKTILDAQRFLMACHEKTSWRVLNYIYN